MPGRRQKLATALQGHRPRAQVVQIQHERARRRAPACPVRISVGRDGSTERQKLHTLVQARWREMWGSPVAGTWSHEADLPRLMRYALDLDRWLTLDALAQKAPIVKGSKGQLVANPLYVELRQLSMELARDEERFGMTPLDRTRLGVDLSEMLLRGQRAAEALAEAAAVDVDEFPVPPGYEVVEAECLTRVDR